MYTIQDLRDKHLIIFECISGSRAYGTFTADSDTDIRGVFIQPTEDILRNGFIEQVSDEKNDVVFYELRRFMYLLINNNPNIIELLNIPEDCVIYKHYSFKLIENNKNKFLTKRVRYTFAAYAIDQIKKARGYNKKMNWEESDMKRKSVLDFCYILNKGGSELFNDWLIEMNAIQTVAFPEFTTLIQKDFGLSKIEHARDLYAIYLLPSEIMGGVYSEKENANDIKLTAIPKELIPLTYCIFNKDAYSIHCRKYLEYETWLKNRNANRVKMNKEHGKQYDSKNMMHCIRLLLMTCEMLDTGEINVRRSPENIELLMSIRNGELEYEDLISIAEGKINMLEEKYNNSSLPIEVNVNDIKELFYQIRTHIQMINYYHYQYPNEDGN